MYGGPACFQRWSAGRLLYTVGARVFIATAVELWGLTTGRWRYADTMPRVPAIGVGVVPLLQIVVLAPVTFWLAGRFMNRPARVRRY